MSVSVSIRCSHCSMGCVASRGGELPIMAEHEERLTAHSGCPQRESYPGWAAETPLGSPAVWECHSTLVPRALRDVDAVGMGSLFTKVSINQDGLSCGGSPETRLPSSGRDPRRARVSFLQRYCLSVAHLTMSEKLPLRRHC